MRNRIVSILVGIMLIAAFSLTGCHFFEYNAERDYKQVVATIAPVESGEYSSGARNIHKYDLIGAINQSYAQSGQIPTEATVDALLQNLVDQELLVIEIERMIQKGTLVWRDGSVEYTDDDAGTITGEKNKKYRDYTDVNKVNKLRYDSIDAELRTIRNEIISNRNDDLPNEDVQTSEPEPTYPVREAETDDTVLPETEMWEPEYSRIPASYEDDAARISLERQALERFVANIVKVIKDGYKEYDAAKLSAAESDFKSKIAARQHKELYLELAMSYPIEFLVGDGTTRQIQSELLQAYLTEKENIGVTQDEVEQRYKSKLETQMLSFTTASNYTSALSGTDTILYRPNGDYFYVKHILVPFSEAQTAQLSAYKAKPNVTEAQIVEFRDRLVDAIVAYPHPDGNDDLSKPTTAKAIFNEVRAAVNGVAASLRDADRKFDDYIYLYNTDPGAFSSTSGYSVKKELAKYEQQTYMTEFEDGARDLYKNYQPGMVLDYFVVTDYGVHIMFYAQDTVAGSIKQIGDFETPGEHKTVFEVMETEIFTAKSNAAYAKWQQAALVERTQNSDYVKTHKSRYKDLYTVS